MKVAKKFVGILSDRIYESRKALGITQEALAAKLGITPQSVSRWENGQSRPDVDMLPRLAAFFGITVDSLFGYRAENLKIAQYEDKVKSGESVNWKFSACEMTREILGLIPPIGQKTVLEIGCGDGQAAVFFARNGYIVSAFDMNNDCLDEGRKLAEEIGVDVNFFCADLLNYKIEQEFDIIYGNGVMQFIAPEDRVRVFQMIQAHTKVGGLNAINAFVEKSFVEPDPDLKDYAHFYQSAELFNYYGRDWKFEMMKEIYCDSDDTPYSHCMDVMIARKVENRE